MEKRITYKYGNDGFTLEGTQKKEENSHKLNVFTAAVVVVYTTLSKHGTLQEDFIVLITMVVMVWCCTIATHQCVLR